MDLGSSLTTIYSLVLLANYIMSTSASVSHSAMWK